MQERREEGDVEGVAERKGDEVQFVFGLKDKVWRQLRPKAKTIGITWFFVVYNPPLTP